MTGAGSKAEALAANAVLTLVSRALMALTPVVCAVFGWIIVHYVDSQNEAVSIAGKKYDYLADVVTQLDKRVSSIEVSRSIAIRQAEESRGQVAAKLDKLADSIIAQSNQLAALTATVAALKDQITPPRYGVR